MRIKNISVVADGNSAYAICRRNPVTLSAVRFCIQWRERTTTVRHRTLLSRMTRKDDKLMNLKLTFLYLVSIAATGLCQAGDTRPAGAVVTECQETNNSVCTAASADTDFAAIAGQGRVTVRRISDQRVLWRSYHCLVSALAFSADGNTLASAGRDRAGLTTIRLWNAHDGAKQLTFTNRQQRIRSLLFEKTGRMLVSYDAAGVFECRGVSDGSLLWSRGGSGAVQFLSRSSDGVAVVCQSSGGTKSFRFADGHLLP